MKTATLLIFLSSFALLSCKKDKLEGEKTVLIGKWAWDYTYHSYNWCTYDNQGITELLTPVNTTNTYTIEFLEKGKLLLYKNDVLLQEKRIVFKYFKTDPAGMYNVGLKLDDDENDIFSLLLIDENSIFTTHFPYSDEKEPCETNDNYFIRE